jgi:hypothetical protein
MLVFTKTIGFSVFIAGSPAFTWALSDPAPANETANPHNSIASNRLDGFISESPPLKQKRLTRASIGKYTSTHLVRKGKRDFSPEGPRNAFFPFSLFPLFDKME